MCLTYSVPDPINSGQSNWHILCPTLRMENTTLFNTNIGFLTISHVNLKMPCIPKQVVQQLNPNCLRMEITKLVQTEVEL